MSAITAILLGLAAGLVGTVVMTISETLESRVTAREPSTVPGQVGSKLLGRPLDGDSPKQLNGVVHWSHGIVMGAIRGLLGLAGLGALAATVLHFLIVWSGDVLLYRSLGIAPMPWRWTGQELATDLFHKGIYALATGVTFELLRSAFY
jgi:hypothetical protein